MMVMAMMIMIMMAGKGGLGGGGRPQSARDRAIRRASVLNVDVAQIGCLVTSGKAGFEPG